MKPGVLISDRYEIIEKVGSGGMADVYKAKDNRLNRFVAIKILKKEYSEDEKFVTKFQAEAQSAAGLSHPNVVNVYDVGEDDGLRYIVMELVEGITLKSFIERKGRLEVKEAIGIAIQIAQGMEAAHANHIIHRDIKPQNIIISKEGKVKVTDFGIAKAVTSDTITSNAMGSVHYISPEQARGGYSDEKSDIYSLGITMYEMLTGQVPFVGDNTVSVALLHIQGEATPIRDLQPDVPISLERIVEKCMQKKPERRYLTAGALIADLKKSILNPNVDFVSTPVVVNDSPTISISDDELSHIKSAAKSGQNVVMHDPEKEIEEPDDDEEEEGEVDPKLEKLMVAGGIIAAVILVLVVLFLVSKLFFSGSGVDHTLPSEPSAGVATSDVSSEPDGEEEMPELVGKTYDEAEKILKAYNVKIKKEEEPSDLYEAGQVIEQTPKEGTKLEAGMEVTLTVSTGKKLTVPDVSGMSKDAAQTELLNSGFKVRFQEEASDSVEAGKVIRTNPEKGSEAAEGDSITVIISTGKETKKVYVPGLIGMTEEKAKEKIKASKLTVGKTQYVNSDSYPEGQVIRQSYSVNAEVDEGTAIELTVSLGPSVTYKYEASVTVVDSPFANDDEEGTIKIVLSQDGRKTTVYNSVCDSSDFPLELYVEGSSASAGTLTVYLDGKQVDSIGVSFKKVAQ